MQVSTSAVNALYEFGPFCLDPQKRILLRGGEALPLTPKGFETLLVLVRNSGRPLSRDELMQAIWPDSFVEEGNLTQNISVLRKVLGSSNRYIVTIPGRGYQFVEQVREIEDRREVTEDAAVAPTATPTPEPGVPGREPGRRPAWALVLLALVIVAAGAGLLLYRGDETQTGIRTTLAAPVEAAVPARRSVAVLGFRNSSGRPGDQWISTAFSEMLNTELAAGNQLRMVSAEDVARARVEHPLPDVASLSKPSLLNLREQLDADLVVLGSYTALRQKDGERIRFDLRLQDTSSGRTIAEQSATGRKAELFQLVTQVGSELRQKLGVAGLSGEESGQVRARVATNPEATRLYAQGLDKLRRFDAQGARSLLEKAIAADPKHALSHSALAEALFDLGYDKKAQQEAKSAFDLSGDLARADHLLIEGRYRQFSGDNAAAIEIYQTLRDFFPDQIDYAFYLANAQWKADHNKDALQTIARMRNLPDPERDDPRIDLLEANVGDALGDFKLTEKMGAAAAAKAQQQGSRLLLAQAKERQGWALEELGVYDQAAALLLQARELFAASGNPLSSAQVLLDLGDVADDRGDLQSAHKFYSQALAEFRRTGALQKAATALSRLGSVATDQGDLENGKRYQEAALRLDREIGWFTARDLGNLAIVLAAMGDLPSAVQMNKESAQSFHHGGDKSNEAAVLIDLADTFLKMGDIPSARQNIVHSTAMLRETGDQRELGYALFTFADLLRAQDRLDEALKLADEDSAIRRQLGDTINLPRTQLLLAQIALDQGKTIEAETLAKDAGRSFDEQRISNWSSLAYACVSQALLEQRKLQAAQLAADRAVVLSQSGREVAAQMEAALAQAGVMAATGQSAEAEKTLQLLRTRALRQGYRGYELRAELALGTVEMNSNRQTTGRQRLTKLQSTAQAEGFLFIARKAQTALHGGSPAL